MNKTVIRELSTRFFEDHPSSMYPEISIKSDRPYNMVTFTFTGNSVICIPFRSKINHSNCYFFKNSIRSKTKKSGLDFSKAVIINDPNYLGKLTVVDQDEANELRIKAKIIHHQLLVYVTNYCDHIKGIKVLSCQEFSRKYRFSTLQYFHDELGLPSKK